MKFDWTNFTEVDFANYCAKAENGVMAPDDYVGCVIHKLSDNLLTYDSEASS